MSVKNLGSTGILYTERRDFLMSPNVVKELWTTVAPFTTIVSNRGTKKVNDPMFKNFEHRSAFLKQEFVANNVAGDVTVAANGTVSAEIAVDGITGLASAVDSSFIGLQCDVHDGVTDAYLGSVIVTAVGTGSVYVKAIKASAIVISADDIFVVQSNAQPEGAEAPEGFGDEIDIVYNSTQIFKTPIEVTGTLYEASLRGYSNELARLRMEKNKEHKWQKEKAFLYGVSTVGTNLDGNGTFSDDHRTDANGKKVRTTYGIVSAIRDYGYTSGDDQNIFDITKATYKYAQFSEDMEKVFQYLPEDGMKYALCGAGAMTYWSSGIFQANSGWDVTISDMKKDSLGFFYKILETSHGYLKLVNTPALRGRYKDMMLVVSDENLEHVQYRAPKFQANIKTDNGYDGIKDQYFSDEGVSIQLLESHKLFRLS